MRQNDAKQMWIVSEHNKRAGDHSGNNADASKAKANSKEDRFNAHCRLLWNLQYDLKNSD